MKASEPQSIRQLLDDNIIFKSLQIGSRRAVKMHKLMGNPVSTMRDGKVIWIPPEETQIDDLPSDRDMGAA